MLPDVGLHQQEKRHYWIKLFLYLQIVSENRQQLYWFGPAVEVPLILFYVLIVVFGLFANGLICYTGTPRVLIHICTSPDSCPNVFHKTG